MQLHGAHTNVHPRYSDITPSRPPAARRARSTIMVGAARVPTASSTLLVTGCQLGVEALGADR